MSTVPTESSRFLGRYELVHPLGQGGMGEVYLAKISGAAGFEKPCIVKTILPALLKDRQFLDRFHHEAKVLVHLVHSSIAQVYDMGEADGTYFMALEYVAGVDLAYLLEQARSQGVAVPVPVALFLGQRIAEGLGYAHRKTGPDGSPLGIVHRDVSPHNVMVSYEGEVKVIDFGLAKSAARSKYTLPSTVMGKLGYMSPEQVRAEPLDHRSDIYSCGVVVWEMLAGRSLIPHGTVGEMMAAMSQPVVPSLSELRPDVDAALDAVVRRALTARPDDRYMRSDELARALNTELVRSGASMGAEEVGYFVRGLCPEAFDAQRKLISKVSSSSNHRRTPAPGYGTGPQQAAGFEPTLMRGPAAQPGFGSGGVARPGAIYADGDDLGTGTTSVRPPSGSSSSVVVASGGEPAASQSFVAPTVVSAVALEERASRKRPVGLYAAIAVLLVIATSAVTALFVQSSGVAPVATGPVAGASGQVAPPLASDKGVEAPGAAARQGATAEAAPLSDAGTGADAGAAVVAAGGPGAAENDKAEPERARAPRPASVKTPAKKPAVPVEPAVVYATPAKVLPIQSANGRNYVDRGIIGRGFLPGAEMDVLGPLKNGKREVLGRARVVRPGRGVAMRPTRAFIELDDRALAASVDLFVAAPGRDDAPAGASATEESQAQVAEPDKGEVEAVVAAAPAKRTLRGHVSVQGGVGGFLDPGVEVQNNESIDWSDCYVVKDIRKAAWLGVVKAGDRKTASRFRHNPNFDVGSGYLGVICKEGELRVKVR
ncbi:serine/threonine-protein kinase [Myxococcus xanthus]|uniref:Serine/threonine protein kinase n=1 Tax=Myxococcus xanthus TaxID=34 RepID=A0AAE6G6Z8_MYXXA|nr:serine/threonine-protein kinase [Myxococcus xanthus]QDE71982.1 serine/threonine protein kinase [Myxococcus xanthus]QDE79264.1 serine/threonine protein kinase [Myxococcus xanthus]QDF00802.1 serine/threonine protein kinase [Myxococcus xanthus]